MRELNCMGRNNNRRNRRRYGSIETIDSYEIDDNQPQQQVKKRNRIFQSFSFKRKQKQQQQPPNLNESTSTEFNKKTEKTRLIFAGKTNKKNYSTLIESDDDDDDDDGNDDAFKSIRKNSKKSVRFAQNNNNNNNGNGNDDDDNSNRKLWLKKNRKKNKKKKSLLKRTGTFIVKSCRLMTYGVPHMPYNLPYNDCNGPYHYDFYRSQDYPYNYNDYGRYDNNQYMRYGEYGPGGLYF
ncbi:uncharacterized protein LOC113799676 [Dermatophagoides pteronyssinus]|uniref:uncharacterized protein LOC113799676 n=1 Tax=Dermatophagoides pteronyssinus TaxID=6956 RepID=UPI003F666349